MKRWRRLLRAVVLAFIFWLYLGPNFEQVRDSDSLWSFPEIRRCQALGPHGKSDYDSSGFRCVVGAGECYGDLP